MLNIFDRELSENDTTLGPSKKVRLDATVMCTKSSLIRWTRAYPFVGEDAGKPQFLLQDL